MAETWVINESPGGYGVMFNVSFTSNQESFTYLTFTDNPPYISLKYGNNEDSVNAFNVVGNSWTDEAYRTIIFEIAPTGDLLTWLQANGTLTPSSSPSTADKLQDLIDIKQDIKEAIENKGADLTGVDFGGYAGKIDTLPSVVELTQSQYDALSVYDDNTYYLIVEE